MATIKNYFPGGNTPEGFYSFYKYLPYNVEKVYIIKGGPGTGKSTFMKQVAYDLNELNYDIEFHWCSSDNDSLDGVVIPDLKTAFLDGTAPHMIDPLYPGAVEKIINLGQYRDDINLAKNKDNIINLTQLISKRFKQSYHYLKSASIIYQHWKNYYESNQEKELYYKVIVKLIDKYIIKKDIKFSPERHLFASAITPEGSVNHLENLTEDIKNRIIINGNPGTGKSQLINDFCNESKKYGYSITYLHCPLEPEKLDGAIIQELNTALIVGTPPHYIEPDSKNDQIINLNETINIDNLKNFYDEILDAEKLYNDLMKRVYYFLRKAKQTHDKLEEYYIGAMDFESIEEYRKTLIKKILP
ncbi:MAG: PRK06851 family protein [Bacillota bacterium]